MTEFIVHFTDGSSALVKAQGYFHAVAKAKRMFRRKRFASVERAHRQYA